MEAVNQKQSQENKMGHAPMLKLIMSMSLPAMFSMLVQALYNVVDSVFVSQISTGDAELTAVSIAFPIQMLLIAFGVGTGIGLNSLVSRRLGEQDFKAANSAATHGILLGILNWVIFAVFGIAFSRLLMPLFTNNAAIAEMSINYLHIVTVFSFGVFIEINLEKTLQATGNMIFPMLFQLSGAIINIIFDPIFIFGWFGLPAMGVTGAAIATVMGQIISMIFAIVVVFTREHAVHITFKGFRLSWRTIKDIYAVGIPSIIMQSIGSLLIMGLNGILKGFSDTATAVLGVYYKLQSFVFMPVFGLTHGVLPIMGYNFGSRNKKRLLDALKIGSIIAFGIMLAGTVLFWLIPGRLLQIFNASEEMLRIGIPALRIISLCFVFAALGIMFSTLFQAIGMGAKSLFISVLRQLVVILPVAWALSKVGLGYVWYAFPIAEVVSLTASIYIFKMLYDKRLQYIQQEDTKNAAE